eukprot:366331-Chlamydomonas_euryale.AAC.14
MGPGVGWMSTQTARRRASPARLRTPGQGRLRVRSGLLSHLPSALQAFLPVHLPHLSAACQRPHKSNSFPSSPPSQPLAIFPHRLSSCPPTPPSCGTSSRRAWTARLTTSSHSPALRSSSTQATAPEASSLTRCGRGVVRAIS